MSGGTYKVEQRESLRGGKLPIYDVTVDGEDAGTINPLFKSMESNRPYAYRTDVSLEWDALTDETGFPNEYPTAREAKAAVDELMRRNGIAKAGAS